MKNNSNEVRKSETIAILTIELRDCFLIDLKTFYLYFLNIMYLVERKIVWYKCVYLNIYVPIAGKTITF